MASLDLPEQGLNMLPDELVIMILDCLPEYDVPTMFALNNTSRRLHNLTIDRLYATFPGYNFEKFLGTVAPPAPWGCPSLALHVKEVNWQSACGIASHLDLEVIRAISDHLKEFKIRFSSLRKTEERFTAKRPSERTMAWYLEVFLLFVPNVERLVVMDAWHWDDHIYWFDAVLDNATHFSHLHSVTIHGPLRIQNIVPLLTLPTLRTLDLTKAEDMRQEQGKPFMWDSSPTQASRRRLGDGSSALEHLTVRNSCIDAEDFIPLFEAFRGLKSFTYEHIGTSREHDSWIDYECLVVCLEHQRTSLEHLSILGDHHLIDEDIDELGVVLPEMTCLESLELNPPRILYAADTPAVAANVAAKISRSLKILTFNFKHVQASWFHEDFRHEFSRFLEALAFEIGLGPRLPNLHQIAVVNWPCHFGMDTGKRPPGFARLQKCFADVGLELQGARQEPTTQNEHEEE
ncbi:hypothetical protein N0V83_009942 [Neocucurbitaria cava]|uniref:F-box domain-containing protein n=1 Tax=Neocucurbitaria cava TaxID=798079 RepID=A0A9W8XZA2_9PLEO|nr:hypothetical protein N0V83_009942 [Neocucurbitaria cava]